MKKVPKDFRDYQNPLKVLENLRDSEVNEKEVLRGKVKLKSDLNEIRLGGNKSIDQKRTTGNIILFFNIRQKVFLRIILFCYLKLSTKQNMEKDLKY